MLRHAAERAFAREDKHERGKILYQNVPQRRVVPLAVKPTEQYARIPYASGPGDRAPSGVRKVRAPQGRMPANGWAGRPDGLVPQKRKLPREHALRRAATGEKLKRCGKSAPARRQRRGLENPIRSKRK